ncbi:LPXTG cell wall anchor domain-containing protein [Streptococcus halichoeri]|uniref:LPXTG cell wall anchor domain-containing protein n=1 Tax=Streptococcus halichoeri TaxID=254785 RepID=UPI0013595AAF|nr:LPXTG cell wall anchor domain-containing protein [Streptococcus halichoeri]
MAKGHWGKKAVLASLVVSAGLLSGQRTVSADEKEKEEEVKRVQYYLNTAQQLSNQIDHLFNTASVLLQRASTANISTLIEGNQNLSEILEKIDNKQRILTLEEVFGKALDENLEYKNVKDKLTSENNKLTEAKLTLEEALRTNFKSLEESQKKQKDLAERLDKAKQSNADLSERMEALQTKAKETAQNLQVSQEKVAQATQQNADLQAKLDKEEKDLTALQKRFDQAASTNSQDKAKLQQELDAKKAEVTGLQSQVTDSANKLKDAQAQVAELSSEKANLAKQKADVEAQLQNQQNLSAQDKAKLEQQLADVQAKITEKENAIKGLESKLTETTAKLENQSKLSAEDKAKLQHELQDLMAKLDMLKKEHDSVPSTPDMPKNPEVKPEAPKVPETKHEEKPAEPKAPEKHSIPWTALTPAAPSTPKKPEIKPAPAPVIPEVKPGKVHPAAPKAKHGKAHHAATPATPHMAPSAQYAAQNTAAHLPQTGEAATSFFTAAALSVMASAGVLSLKRQRKEN